MTVLMVALCSSADEGSEYPLASSPDRVTCPWSAPGILPPDTSVIGLVANWPDHRILLLCRRNASIKPALQPALEKVTKLNTPQGTGRR